MPARNLAARMGRWSARHRKAAVLGWLAFVGLALAIGTAVGTVHIRSEDTGTGESQRADRALASSGFRNPASESVLIQVRRRGERIDARLAVVRDVVRRVEAVPAVARVRAPLGRDGAGLRSRDGRSALVQLDLAGDRETAQDRVAPVLAAVAAAQADHPEVRIEEFGDASADRALSRALDRDFHRAEGLSLPITLVILVLAFGSLAAAGLPLLLALSAVGGALGLVGMTSHALPVDESISSLVLLIGLAVGVDYSLFYIRRAREERAAGSDAAGAVQAASATSGRAILISGITVMVAMAGMYLTGNQVFTGFANGMVIVVAVAMLGSVTALPATLAWLGDRVERGHVPLLGGRWREAIEARAWSAVLDVVLRRPLLSALVAVALLVALCVPALGLHTVQAGTQGLPRSIPIMRTYDRIQTAFPGGPLPAQVVVEAADVRAPGVAGAIRALRRRAVATGLMQEPIEVDVNRSGTVARVAIPLAGSGTDARSVRALRALRAEVIPATLGRVEGVRFGVSGMTAWSTDFNDLLRSRAPWVFVFVLGLAFLLLLVTFRSIVIPIKAIVLNLLSVGAAYGVLVLVFQDGYGESLLGFRSIGGIVAWLPLFLFVILFGLSMDYHVFILSRIREAFDRGMSTDRAVAFGIKSTASVVTSAAFVMVAVFAIFATLSTIDMKQIGVGLAVAILIDATLVRAVLLPASMKLLGDWNWYLPRALRWLPRITHEPAAS